MMEMEGRLKGAFFFCWMDGIGACSDVSSSI